MVLKNKNISFLILILSVFSFLNSWGQNISDEKIVNRQIDYISRVSYSLNKKYYVLAHGSSGVTLLDSAFNVLKEFTYNANWGGCGGVFSADGNSLAIVKSGDIDTLVIYNLINHNTKELIGGFNNLMSLKSNKLLIDAYDGNFSLYDFSTGILQQNIITPIKETRPYD